VSYFFERFGPVYIIGQDSPSVNAMQVYLESGEHAQHVRPARMISLVSMLLSELVGAGSSATAGQPSAHLVRRACELIEVRAGRPISVVEVAEKLGVTREHLARVFRRDMRATPNEVINRVKTRRACVLLERSTQSVSDIARRVGFENPSHFARVFRRVTKLSPSEYREVGCPPIP